MNEKKKKEGQKENFPVSEDRPTPSFYSRYWPKELVTLLLSISPWLL